MVAGHRFGVSGEADDFALMGNYEPFASSDGDTVSPPNAPAPQA